MELPPLTLEQLSQLIASNLPPSQLFEVLTQYEQEACLIPTDSGSSQTAGDAPLLLSSFYASFFLVHLLTDQVLVTRSCQLFDCCTTNGTGLVDLKLAP
jgi:COP9 signalosome complex subunit 8